MALKSTIFKAELQIADLDRGHYGDYALTLARHPSETDERMMVRLFAFARHADEALSFGKGLSTDDEPDLWLRELTGDIALWIDVGLPDEKWIRKASNRSNAVAIYVYGGRSADIWWSQQADKLSRLDNLSVYLLPQEASQGLTAFAERTMQLQCTLQDGQVWLTDGKRNVEVTPAVLKAATR